MHKTYIIGSGYLSSKILKKFKNCEVLSSNQFLLKIDKINKSKKKINLIINAFYSARKLNKLESYKHFVKKSLLDISEVFDNINPKLITKIIYTSSSSVYGSIGGKIEVNDKNNRYIYSSFKISAENLIKNFCNKNKIFVDVCRVFNLYGSKDGFSIISKLADLKKGNNTIEINNNGESVRDFIHVDDVVSIYKKLLKKNDSNIYDIGTGNGVKIKDIILNLKLPPKKVRFNKKNSHEIDISIADNTNLIKKIKLTNFKKLEYFLKINALPRQKKLNSNYLENTLIGSIIYGAGFSGRELYKQLIKYDENIVPYFVDDDQKKHGKNINNVKILSFNELNELSKKIQIRNIIVAIPSLKKKDRLNLFRKILPLSSNISTLPQKNFYKNNKIDIDDLNEISLDEVLDKKILESNDQNLNTFEKKTILVTGGAGSIGTEITRQLLKSKLKKLIILDHSELNIYRINQKLNSKKLKIILGNIQDKILLEKIIKINKVDYIFHAAAYKHVKFLEDNIYAATKNNILGTQALIESIKGKKINFTFISTDKAVEPKTVLGITKRVGELLVHFASNHNDYKKTKFTIVRFGNVIGSDGSALPYFINQIKKNQTITVTDKKMQRYFMTIKEACKLVLQSTLIDSKNKILFLDMGKPVKIVDIIKKIFNICKKPDQKLKLRYIGNKFNEKISEKLSSQNAFYKTKFNKINFIYDKTKKKSDVNIFLNLLNNKINIYDNKKLLNIIKNFIK